MAVLEWEKLLLYPANTPVRDIPIQPSVKVPAGWGIGTALTPTGSGPYPVPAAGSTTQYAVTNVEQLEDSPVITGQYFHEFPLAPEITPKHYHRRGLGCAGGLEPAAGAAGRSQQPGARGRALCIARTTTTSITFC